jgi:hypothetical protein
VLPVSLASWCHWDEMGCVSNRLGAESHTEEFRAACKEVWQQNRLVVERGVDRGVAAEMAPCWKWCGTRTGCSLKEA